MKTERTIGWTEGGGSQNGTQLLSLSVYAPWLLPRIIREGLVSVGESTDIFLNIRSIQSFLMILV